MTVTLDIPAYLAGRVEADARTQNRAVADLLLDAVADRWDGDDEVGDDLPADIYLTHPLPASLTEPLSETARKVDADLKAGRVIDGDTFLAEMRTLTGRTA